jgi:hypothetical protein
MVVAGITVSSARPAQSQVKEMRMARVASAAARVVKAARQAKALEKERAAPPGWREKEFTLLPPVLSVQGL